MTGLKRLGGVTFHHAGAFWFGVVAVTAGVIAHIPMYMMGGNIGYRLAGMPMDTPMKIGMAAIVVGLVVEPVRALSALGRGHGARRVPHPRQRARRRAAQPRPTSACCSRWRSPSPSTS